MIGNVAQAQPLLQWLFLTVGVAQAPRCLMLPGSRAAGPLPVENLMALISSGRHDCIHTSCIHLGCWRNALLEIRATMVGMMEQRTSIQLD